MLFYLKHTHTHTLDMEMTWRGLMMYRSKFIIHVVSF